MDNAVLAQEKSVKMNPVEKAKGAIAAAVFGVQFAMTTGQLPMAFNFQEADVNTEMSTDAATMLGSAIGMILMVIAGFGIGVLIVGFVDVAQSFMSDQPEKRTKGFALITAGVIMIGLRSILIAAGIINS